MINSQDDVHECPSFSSYSTDRLAEIAVKVVGENNDEFEFTFLREDKHVLDGQIGTVFPVFDQDKQFESSVTVPLSIEDRDYPASCSSSELDSIPAGTYCVWRPKAWEPPLSPNQCKKSKSTGSASKRWKFRDLLRRSNSEGKDSFVFLTPKNQPPTVAPKKAKGKVVTSGGRAPSAHETLYVWNRAIKEVDKKKSYLPYRQDLVGFFVNANGLSKSFPHF